MQQIKKLTLSATRVHYGLWAWRVWRTDDGVLIGLGTCRRKRTALTEALACARSWDTQSAPRLTYTSDAGGSSSPHDTE